jgi:hypothetical protein
MRQANRTPTNPRASISEVTLKPHEFAWLTYREAKPGKQLGGYQRMVNWVIDTTDRQTMIIALDPLRFERLKRYIQRYGGGGPNTELRRCFIPALRRIGIDLAPEWATPSSTESNHQPTA